MLLERGTGRRFFFLLSFFVVSCGTQKRATTSLFPRREGDPPAMRLISGTSNSKLAATVASILGLRLHPVDIRRFSDGEVYVEIQETIRGEEVFIFQPTS